MSIILSGAQNIYKSVIEWTVHSTKSLVIVHTHNLTPGGSDDNPSVASFAVEAQYNHLLATIASDVDATFTIQTKAVLDRHGPTHEVFLPTLVTGNTIPPAPPERAIRIRRVGAGGTLHDKGRCRIGPAGNTFFLDPGRWRRVNVTHPDLVFAIALMNTMTGLSGFNFGECLFDRRTGNARPVIQYSIAPYSSAVWQRAGFPQGVRGPDRG